MMWYKVLKGIQMHGLHDDCIGLLLYICNYNYVLHIVSLNSSQTPVLQV